MSNAKAKARRHQAEETAKKKAAARLGLKLETYMALRKKPSTLRKRPRNWWEQ